MLPPDRSAGPAIVGLDDLARSPHAEVPSWTGLGRLAIAGTPNGAGAAAVPPAVVAIRPGIGGSVGPRNVGAPLGSPGQVVAVRYRGPGRRGVQVPWLDAWRDGDALVEAVRAAGTAALLGRAPLAPVHVRALAVAREGRLGDLRLLREDRGRPRPLATVAHHRPPARPTAIGFADVIRVADLFGRFLTAAPLRVAAEVRGHAGPFALVIGVTYANGALAVARVHDGGDAADAHRFELVGSTARFAARAARSAVVDDGGGAVSCGPTPADVAWLEPLARALGAGRPPPPAPPAAVRTLRLALAVAASIARGGPVPIDPHA